MHYSYALVVLPAHTVTNPLTQRVILGAGIIKHVSFVFPPGCARMVRVVFTDNAVQLLPTNQDAYYSEDSHAVEADCYIRMEDIGNEFWLVAWNIGATYQHQVNVHFDVEGIDEPKPLDSVMVLGEAVNNLTTLMRGFF